MKIQSRGELSLEAMQDAPEGEWLRTFLADYNDLKRQVVATTKVLTFGDNTPYREKSIELVHGVETEILSPLEGSRMRVKSVCSLQVDGLTLDASGKSTGVVYPLGLLSPIAWRPSDSAGKVIVTAKFDITPSAGVTGLVNLLFVGG